VQLSGSRGQLRCIKLPTGKKASQHPTHSIVYEYTLKSIFNKEALSESILLPSIFCDPKPARMVFTREYTQCTAGYTFCFVVVGVGAVFSLA
jgi:hypothetical protein